MNQPKTGIAFYGNPALAPAIPDLLKELHELQIPCTIYAIEPPFLRELLAVLLSTSPYKRPRHWSQIPHTILLCERDRHSRKLLISGTSPCPRTPEIPLYLFEKYLFNRFYLFLHRLRFCRAENFRDLLAGLTLYGCEKTLCFHLLSEADTSSQEKAKATSSRVCHITLSLNPQKPLAPQIHTVLASQVFSLYEFLFFHSTKKYSDKRQTRSS